MPNFVIYPNPSVRLREALRVQVKLIFVIYFWVASSSGLLGAYFEIHDTVAISVEISSTDLIKSSSEVSKSIGPLFCFPFYSYSLLHANIALPLRTLFFPVRVSLTDHLQMLLVFYFNLKSLLYSIVFISRNVIHLFYVCFRKLERQLFKTKKQSVCNHAVTSLLLLRVKFIY